MKHRRRLILAAAGALIAQRSALAQQPGKVYRVGLLSVGTSADPKEQDNWQAFINAMRELGYVEGKNLALRRAFGSSNFERLPELVADLVRSNVDVIVTTGTREIRAAKQATSTIPIVMTLAADP
ncbi:MAG: ABC transporter substrate binding protein, partial [Burkholderiales bacterium]